MQPPAVASDLPAKTTKGRQTRARILETALRLFRERGYEATTMRLIAESAGVSLGNAYYYFKSKEHLIQAFYARTHDEHLAACGPILETETGLGARLAGVLCARLNTSMPYHRFAGLLFKTAADPKSPLSPFSPESLPVRRESTRLMAAVLEGSDVAVPEELMEELPNLLWIYLLGIVLFWIHDSSPGCDRSYRLVERTSEIVARLIRLSRLAVLRPLVKTVLGLLRDLRVEEIESANEGASA